MKLTEFVYHSSTKNGLKILEPQISTHGKSYVYATKHLEVAACFLGRWDDYDIALERSENGKICLTERYSGAFDKIYRQASGSIYKLFSDGFIENQTNWDEEVVCASKVLVIEETIVTNSWNFISELNKKNFIHIFYYPNKPQCIPQDDSDILEKAVLWFHQYGEKNKERFLSLHPHLTDRFEKLLNSLDVEELKRKYITNQNQY